MSRLVEYIKKGRGKEISEYEAKVLIHQNCSKSLKAWKKDGYYIQRNTIKLKRHYYVNPAKSAEPRISANTKNYYTIIMDNSPLWKQYPKRSKSLICLSGNAQRMFHMFPYDNTKIGVCPYRDIWTSWQNLFVRLSVLNNELWRMFVDTNVVFNVTMKTIKEFKNACKQFDKLYEENGLEYTPNWFNENYNGDLWKTLIKLLSPKTDNFRLINAGNKIPNLREVWFSGECIMVRDISSLIGILKNE